ncbi:MAG: sulfite oxidase [Bacteroidota bacterium]
MTNPEADPAVGLHQQKQSRRSFLKVAGAGSALILGQGCEPADDSPEDEAFPPAFFKDTSPFIQHGTNNLEAKIENLGGFITPNDQFFVRNNSQSIAIAPADYNLQVGGEGVADALSFSLDEIKNMPSRSVYAYIECGGNQRAFFGSAMGQPARGTQWTRGGVGMAIWTGVPLREVLQRAGIKPEAVDVQLIGLDQESPEGGFRRPLPVAKALDPDTILAYQMNGAPLPQDHGFPLRAIVPGWVGSANIKWLGNIVVTTERVWSRNNTTSYVLIGDDYPAEGKSKGRVATSQSIKSTLILPWPADLKAGHHMIRGYAYSPHAPVASVKWRTGEGAWQEAQFIDPPIKYAWRRFEFLWDAPAGSHMLSTVATDEAGNTQPDAIPHNEKGYLYNVPLEHPVTVT